MNASLARTDSFVSVVSEDGSIASAASSEVKRTRKRFTNVQVMLLEQLFHETSHPTREQREKLSQKAELYVDFSLPRATLTDHLIVS